MKTDRALGGDEELFSGWWRAVPDLDAGGAQPH
jgi:hypothetical protein